MLFAGIEIPPKMDNSYWSKAFLKWLATVEFKSLEARKTLDLLLEQYEFIYRHFLKTSIQVRKIQSSNALKNDAVLLRSIPGIGPFTTV